MFLAANGIGCLGRAERKQYKNKQTNKLKIKANHKAHFSVYHSSNVHKPVCAGLIKLSFDCATAITFAVFIEGAPGAFRDGAPVNSRRNCY